MPDRDAIRMKESKRPAGWAGRRGPVSGARMRPRTQEAGFFSLAGGASASAGAASSGVASGSGGCFRRFRRLPSRLGLLDGRRRLGRLVGDLDGSRFRFGLGGLGLGLGRFGLGLGRRRRRPRPRPQGLRARPPSPERRRARARPPGRFPPRGLRSRSLSRPRPPARRAQRWLIRHRPSPRPRSRLRVPLLLRPRHRAPSRLAPPSDAASWSRTWANAAASVLSIPPSGSCTASDIE